MGSLPRGKLISLVNEDQGRSCSQAAPECRAGMLRELFLDSLLASRDGFEQLAQRAILAYAGTTKPGLSLPMGEIARALTAMSGPSDLALSGPARSSSCPPSNCSRTSAPTRRGASAAATASPRRRCPSPGRHSPAEPQSEPRSTLSLRRLARRPPRSRPHHAPPTDAPTPASRTTP